MRGFKRVGLEAGEAKIVKFTIKPVDLQLLDRNMKLIVKPGEFEVLAGSSSEDIRLKQSFFMEE